MNIPSPNPSSGRYSVDFDRAPYLVIWETTRACDLACVHCRAEAQKFRNPNELSAGEAISLMDEIARFGEPVVVLTGGDPLKRPDIFPIIRYGASLGLRMTMTPSGTPLMTPDTIARAHDSGLRRLAVSLDGSSAASHDSFRKVAGSFQWSVDMLAEARKIGLTTQVNTTVTRRTIGDMDAICELVETLGVSLWSIFFLVPMGRGRPEDEVSAEDYESVFAKMYAWSRRVPFDIKSTAAPHYRRYALQQRVKEARQGPAPAGRPLPPGLADGIVRAPKAVNDGNGLVFVSHVGEIYPSGFLPLSAGNVRRRSLVEAYQEDPLFRRLRDYDQLLGKCGQCDFRNVCGGSRGRAYAMSGNILESEPYCSYIPPAYARLVEAAAMRV